MTERKESNKVDPRGLRDGEFGDTVSTQVQEDPSLCWGEQGGLRGCAGCPLVFDMIEFLKGNGLNEDCRPKMERRFGKQITQDLAEGKAQYDPGLAIMNLA